MMLESRTIFRRIFRIDDRWLKERGEYGELWLDESG